MRVGFQDGVGTTWGSNHGIGAVRYRKDGFVAVTAPSVFQSMQAHQAARQPASQRGPCYCYARGGRLFLTTGYVTCAVFALLSQLRSLPAGLASQRRPFRYQRTVQRPRSRNAHSTAATSCLEKSAAARSRSCCLAPPPLTAPPLIMAPVSMSTLTALPPCRAGARHRCRKHRSLSAIGRTSALPTLSGGASVASLARLQSV